MTSAIAGTLAKNHKKTGVHMKKTNTEKVLDTLLKFQNGYYERNLQNVDTFAKDLFIDNDETVIIGTGDGEKCIGLEEIKDLLRIDWEYWGNLELNIEDAIITAHGKVAWIVSDGTLSKKINNEKVHSNCINRVNSIFDSFDTSEEKLLKSLKSIAYSLHETKIGDGICRPVRFSAILIEEDEVWKFSHIHFSYPVGPPTDIKIIRE